MINLLISLLFFSIPHGSRQQVALESDLSLMYRKSGETALTYRKLSSGDTVHYYKRWMNPYFRVYSFKFGRDSILVGKMKVESYFGNSLLKTMVLRPRMINNRTQYVDTSVEKIEDLVKITVHYTDLATNDNEDFVIFILPDKDRE